MPVIAQKSYRPTPLLWNGHMQTIIPSLFKTAAKVPYTRERIFLPDGDFLDLDWICKGSRRLIVISHGLEGSSQSVYVRSLVRLATQLDFDILAWNCRSCGGELNLLPKLYYHGDVHDIQHVVQHAQDNGQYEHIALVGFSLGANISLKTVGITEICKDLPVRLCIGVSAPCDLGAASTSLDRPVNLAYKLYFKKMLFQKMKAKAQQFPGWISLRSFLPGQSFREVDEQISAPINGFKSAEEFYYHSSSKNFVGGTPVPTLILNAKNDPVLTSECQPVELAESNSNIYLEMPRQGGHVGFPEDRKFTSWADRRIMQFIEQFM